MAKKTRKQAYVVFRGRVPGVYRSWEECDAQVNGFSKQKFLGFDSFTQASKVWEEWQRKSGAKLAASAPPENAARAWAESLSPPTPWIEPRVPQQTSNLARPASGTQDHTSSDSWQPSSSQPTQFYYEPPLTCSPIPEISNTHRLTDDTIHQSRLQTPQAFQNYSIPLPPLGRQLPNIQGQAGVVDLTRPSPLLQDRPKLKRSVSCIDLTDELDNEEPAAKRLKPEVPELTVEERYELDQLEQRAVPTPGQEETKVELSPEQEKVVKLALGKNNIFLTGAAGCGKTVTLKEILARLKKKKKGGKVQVVAPTGIAALPLDGKTTYSFAGWNPDSLRKGIGELLKQPKLSVVKAINDLDVLIIEEISMVENQFLERLNLLFQNAVMNKLPFGGKQVIFLGDFHQLPPVKPFEYCLRCGESISLKQEPICTSRKCKALEDQTAFKRGDKWAFRAPVWRELKLRHVKLEQIHRQKDSQFQDILNKIRNGTELSADEWKDLERPKELPPGAFAVRLMSRLAQVKRFNEQQLAALKSQPKAWRAQDSCKKLIESKDGYRDPAIPHKIHEYKESLRDHRFIPDLALKVGARVVLLQNLNHEKGLVNGSQGVVIGFQPATQELEKIMEMSGDHQEVRLASMQAFQSSNGNWRPLVRFANGHRELISAFASASLRGGSEPQDQYVVCRTQIPLTLAWALSIHKSQGMTLEYVEVLSQDIFESGQLYVALSRATHLNGLRLTGFSRKQLPMDKDVLEFYSTTKWEKLQPRAKKKS